MGEQSGSGTSALDGARGQRHLDEALATAAGQPWPDDPVGDEAAGHVFEFFGHVLADPAQLAAAIGAGVSRRVELHLQARDMVRDRPALRPLLLLDLRQAQPRRHRSGCDLTRLQRQLQLLGRLGGGAEAMRLVSSQLVAQLLDQDRLRLHLGQKSRRESAQLLGIFGKGNDLVEHDQVYLTGSPMGILAEQCRAVIADYPAAEGCQVRCGIRQSMPSSSIASCAGVSDTLPPFAEGQTNLPRSSRFTNMQAPCVRQCLSDHWRSIGSPHQITFTRSPRRPRKTKRCPAKGSCWSVASAWAASAAKPRRMSVTPAASQTLVMAGTGITRTGPGSTGQVPRDRSGH
jgi:hypothetical protein